MAAAVPATQTAAHLLAIVSFLTASEAMAARRHPTCVAVMIEMVPARICPPVRRR